MAPVPRVPLCRSTKRRPRALLFPDYTDKNKYCYFLYVRLPRGWTIGALRLVLVGNGIRFIGRSVERVEENRLASKLRYILHPPVQVYCIEPIPPDERSTPALLEY